MEPRPNGLRRLGYENRPEPDELGSVRRAEEFQGTPDYGRGCARGQARSGRSGQPELFLILLAGDEDLTVG
jgi:hypothetical protein